MSRHVCRGPYEKYMKRPLDIALSAGALAVLSPVLGTVAVLVRVQLGSPVRRIRDFTTGLITDCSTGETSEIGLPKSNILFYDLEDRGTAIIRPSGTEPKIKFYIMVAADSLQEADAKLAAIDAAGSDRLS